MEHRELDPVLCDNERSGMGVGWEEVQEEENICCMTDSHCYTENIY